MVTWCTHLPTFAYRHRPPHQTPTLPTIPPALPHLRLPPLPLPARHDAPPEPANRSLRRRPASLDPGWKVTLLESMQKRCSFLKHAIELTGLSNVQIVCARAENVGQGSEYREVFDVAVARAVAEMRTLAEYCLPLVRVGGLFVAAKGHDPQEEVRNAEKAVRLMGASMLELCSVESQGPYGKRTAVVCLKVRPTPKRYPRQPGIPTKTPL